ncbi:hypothetical protein [Rhodoferax sp. OV413]|uniref:hypothetical protein n=1 Tax=Rhodoferax sp. OV413 TaxID=1855285 RepID=UPI0025CC791B|nr:hypothetical protein [Rhodoferax sp. OV413]
MSKPNRLDEKMLGRMMALTLRRRHENEDGHPEFSSASRPSNLFKKQKAQP